MRIVLVLVILSIISCQSKTYDYIIVGGGASGTIASVELAKKYPNSSVLLLERGMSDTDAPATHSLGAWPELLIDNDIHEVIRYVDGVWTILGKVLSGGSGMNAGIMGQENQEFFTKTFGFNEEQNARVKAMYQKLYDELAHKTTLSDLGKDLIAAAEELGLNNTGYQHGYVNKNTTFQTYSAFDMTKNTRNTTADYIRNSMARGEVPNLTVQVKTLVTRLIISNDNQIAGVSVMNNGVSEIYSVRGSVILSAGAIKTTQLLQVSGIGSFSELQAAGIPTTINNEEVGKNYIDRLLESMAQFSPLNVTIPLTPISSLSVEEGMLEERTAGGTVAASFAIVMGSMFPPSLRSSVNLEAFKLFLQNYPRLKDCVNNAIQINILVANPTSRGYIKALTPNINDAPEIDAKFIDTAEDKVSSEKAKKKAQSYYDASPLKKYARKQTGPSTECGLLIDFPVTMLATRSSSLHLFGGATFGKVLDNDFRVKGIDNLYVIDASVFPRATEINPFNTISALGGFISQEFVSSPENSPQLPPRVQIINKQEPDKCMAIGSPIYSAACDKKAKNTLFWIQEVSTGKYVIEVKENTAYLLRSSQDDRYCIYHVIGGLTEQDQCSTKYKNQQVFFNLKGEYVQIKFNMSTDTGPCMMKWWGSNTISGFSCSFPQTDRLQWTIKVIDS